MFFIPKRQTKTNFYLFASNTYIKFSDTYYISKNPADFNNIFQKIDKQKHLVNKELSGKLINY